jgi:hypothetical protein
MRKLLSAESINAGQDLCVASDIDALLDDDLLQRVVKQTSNRIAMLCDPCEIIASGSISIPTDRRRLVLGAASAHAATGLPSRIFFGAGVADEDLHILGTLEGTQAYGVPFVGYIETREDKRRSGLASHFLPILSNIVEVIYGSPLTSGPQTYLSEAGRMLQANLAQVHNLAPNDLGFVAWR